MASSTAVATLLAIKPLAAGRPQTLGAEAAHHLRVVRAALGDVVSLRDGSGCAGTGNVVRMTRSTAVVDVVDVWKLDQLPAVHLLAPVADRERMLWLAEKVTELGVTSWRPVMWRRSKSVSPRGEGTMFQQKLRARMTAAMLQSLGGWIPETFPDATVERGLTAAPEGTRLLLDWDGDPMLSVPFIEPVTIALGPEGGVEPREREILVAGGFAPVSLGPARLRFETAGVAAVAIARSALAVSIQQPSKTRGAAANR